MMGSPTRGASDVGPIYDPAQVFRGHNVYSRGHEEVPMCMDCTRTGDIHHWQGRANISLEDHRPFTGTKTNMPRAFAGFA